MGWWNRNRDRARGVALHAVLFIIFALGLSLFNEREYPALLAESPTEFWNRVWTFMRLMPIWLLFIWVVLDEQTNTSMLKADGEGLWIQNASYPREYFIPWTDVLDRIRTRGGLLRSRLAYAFVVPEKYFDYPLVRKDRSGGSDRFLIGPLPADEIPAFILASHRPS